MPDDDVPVNQNPGEYIVPASTPVLRADALDDEEHRPDEPQSPVEEPEAPAKGDDTHVHADGGGISSYSPLDGPREPELLVCPVCGLVTCFHNLARVPKE